MFDASVGLISEYLALAFPDPSSHVVERWTLSCLPSTTRHSRLFTLNIGPMEVLYVIRAYPASADLSAQYVSRSALEEETGKSVEDLAHSMSAIEFVPSTLALGDGDALVVVVDLAHETASEELDSLLGDGYPIRRLAEQLVTKGKGPYEQYHNRWLAAAVLVRSNATLGTDTGTMGRTGTTRSAATTPPPSPIPRNRSGSTAERAGQGVPSGRELVPLLLDLSGCLLSQEVRVESGRTRHADRHCVERVVAGFPGRSDNSDHQIRCGRIGAGSVGICTKLVAGLVAHLEPGVPPERSRDYAHSGTGPCRGCPS